MLMDHSKKSEQPNRQQINKREENCGRHEDGQTGCSEKIPINDLRTKKEMALALFEIGLSKNSIEGILNIKIEEKN